MKKTKWLYLSASVVLLLIPCISFFYEVYFFPGLIDFASYSAISRALFEGINPFPDHHDVLFCRYQWGQTVPIGQMLLFSLSGTTKKRLKEMIFFI